MYKNQIYYIIAQFVFLSGWILYSAMARSTGGRELILMFSSSLFLFPEFLRLISTPEKK